MCITCNVKVKGLYWLKVALYFVEEHMIMCLPLYFVAAVLRRTRESCDEIPSGAFGWISLRTFHPNNESFLICFSVFFFLHATTFWMRILFPSCSNQVSLDLPHLGTERTSFTESTDTVRTPVTAVRLCLPLTRPVSACPSGSAVAELEET